jgi:hypothetical protein
MIHTIEALKHPLTSLVSAEPVQKSEQRPPRSQSPYRVGSGPLGPPISPVALFMCSPPSFSASPSLTEPASLPSAPAAAAASSPSRLLAASASVDARGGSVEGAELDESAWRRTRAAREEAATGGRARRRMRGGGGSGWPAGRHGVASVRRLRTRGRGACGASPRVRDQKKPRHAAAVVRC